GGGGGSSTPPPPAQGQLIVWTALTAVPGGSINISVDNAVVGNLAKFRTTPPVSCADTGGTFVTTVNAGTHSVGAASSTQPGITWLPANYNVPANGCMVIELF
ncbi:MAG: hypothetical protein ABL915_08735, partial [Gallionella sp.]